MKGEQANRIEKVREAIDRIIERIPDRAMRREAYIHLYGVSQACGLIAMKRGEDPELAAIAGMLHDIWTYSALDPREHAHRGAGLAREILHSTGLFDGREVDMICHAVYHHSGKAICQEPFDEVLKDADVLGHCMYDPQKEPKAKEYGRFERLKAEFGLQGKNGLPAQAAGESGPESERGEAVGMTKEELALEVIKRLKKEYPMADCTLDYDQAWKLLVSVRLAAQCTDARVNVVVEDLYKKYPDINALAEAPVEEIEKIVKPCGLGHSKARDISACMKMLKEQYGSKVPEDFDALLKLPGVGRKSANLIMGDVFGKPAIVTDTHCIRLVNRMGLVDNIKDPKKVEMALWKLVPPKEGSDFCHRLVYHGREVCTARTKPHCDRCCVKDICGKHGV